VSIIRRAVSLVTRLLARRPRGASRAAARPADGGDGGTLPQWQVSLLTIGIGVVAVLAATMPVWRHWLDW
jgi:hypothetical protein